MKLDPASLSNTLAAIRRSPHRYIGIRPLGSVPNEAPCALISTEDPTNRNINTLMYTLDTAGEAWPEAASWEIVASDEQLLHQPQDLPPTVVILRSPEIIATLQGPPPTRSQLGEPDVRPAS